MLNKFAQLVSHALFHHFDAQRNPSRVTERNRVLRQAGFIFSIWMMYFAGATIGATLTLTFGLQSLFFASGILVLSIVADQCHPLSAQEEGNDDEFEESNRAA